VTRRHGFVNGHRLNQGRRVRLHRRPAYPPAPARLAAARAAEAKPHSASRRHVQQPSPTAPLGPCSAAALQHPKPPWSLTRTLAAGAVPGVACPQLRPIVPPPRPARASRQYPVPDIASSHDPAPTDGPPSSSAVSRAARHHGDPLGFVCFPLPPLYVYPRLLTRSRASQHPLARPLLRPRPPPQGHLLVPLRS